METFRQLNKTALGLMNKLAAMAAAGEVTKGAFVIGVRRDLCVGLCNGILYRRVVSVWDCASRSAYYLWQE